MKTTHAILLRLCVPAACWARLETSTDHTVLLQSQVRKTDSKEYQAAAELFPSITSLSDPKSSKAALAQIERAVTAMHADRSQITPTVSGIVTTVIDLLDAQLLSMNETEYGAIFKAHMDDQHELDTLAPIMNVSIPPQAAELASVSQTVGGQVAATLQCEQHSITLCEDVSFCTGENQSATTEWAEKNQQLKNKDVEIDDYWCPDDLASSARGLGGGNTSAFREHTSGLFVGYNNLLQELLNLTADQGAEWEQCHSNMNAYTTHLVTCASLYSMTLASQCSVFGSMQHFRTMYETAKNQADTNYQNEDSAVKLRELDRKIEWDVVTRVVCLLTTLTTVEDVSVDGDISSESNTAVIAACKDDAVDTTHLNIEYYDIPAPLTLPDLPEHPCSESFQDGITLEDALCGDGITIPNITDADGNPTNNVAVDSTEYGGGVHAECFCNFNENSLASDQSLPHYLLLATEVNLGDFVVDTTHWEYETVYTGLMSECSTLPASADVRFAGTLAAKRCHMYGSGQAQSDASNAGSATAQDQLLSRGGFVYLDADSQTIGVLAWTSITATLTFNQAPERILTFAAPANVTVSEPCGVEGFVPCPSSSVCPAGASHYCWSQERLIVQWTDIMRSYTLLQSQLSVSE